MPPSQDIANTLRQQAETISVLTHLGFDRSEVVKAVTSGDLSTLK
jgi:hypothetical protein